MARVYWFSYWMGCLCITGYLPGSQRFVKSLRQFAGTSSRCHSWVESGNIPIELEYGPVELDFIGLFSNKGESYIVTGRMDQKKLAWFRHVIMKHVKSLRSWSSHTLIPGLDVPS